MRIFGMILAIVGVTIIVFFGMRTADTGAADPAFVVALAFGGPLTALGLLIVAIRKSKKKTPEDGA